MAKDKAIMFRVTDADKQEIEDQAQKLGLSLSSYFLMLHKKNTNKGGNTMRNLNTITSIPDTKGWHKMIEIPVVKGATTKDMADLLRQDFTFNDAFMEILEQNEEAVEDWLNRNIKEGWVTLENGNLIVWVEYF
jgi:antitoxin component of RelBE/YafQ-DinJ toxin-antitoxin module